MADRPARLPSASRPLVAICLMTLCSLVFASYSARGSDLRMTPIVKAVQGAGPSVVNIRGEKTMDSSHLGVARGDAGKRVNGMGTGVVIDSRGYIITNHHVVDGVREIQVTLSGGQQYTAKLMERDPETDLAIIKIDSIKPLPVINIGTSGDLMPGEPVVAVGNAFGYEDTVTRGIISALHRGVQVSDAQYYDDLIQTDASINPGNSGGPLLNIDGKMIGINVAVRAGAQGIGFAIPVDKAMAVAADLLAASTDKRGWHGVSFANDSLDAAGKLVVGTIPRDSPAEKAGLKAGDTITATGDQQIERQLDFYRAILELDAGDEVLLVVERGEERLELPLQIAGVPSGTRTPTSPNWELLGLDLDPIPTEEFQQKYQTRYRGGLAVTAVRPQSPASSQGICQGDVLVGMHIWETISLENVEYVFSRPDLPAFNPMKFYILRGAETLYGYLPLPLAIRTALQR